MFFGIAMELLVRFLLGSVEIKSWNSGIFIKTANFVGFAA